MGRLKLFDALPLDQAMGVLLPHAPREEFIDLTTEAVAELDGNLACQAALWLYIDDLDRSHTLSQHISGPLGAYWHGIMHRREGDFANAKYWLRQIQDIKLGIDDYEPQTFVDRVAAANGLDHAEIVALQRREWQALFALSGGHS